MFFTFETNLPYAVLLATSLLTALLSLLKSKGAVFNFSTTILSASAFKFAKFDFSANLKVLFPVAFLNQLLFHN